MGELVVVVVDDGEKGEPPKRDARSHRPYCDPIRRRLSVGSPRIRCSTGAHASINFPQQCSPATHHPTCDADTPAKTLWSSYSCMQELVQEEPVLANAQTSHLRANTAARRQTGVWKKAGAHSQVPSMIRTCEETIRTGTDGDMSARTDGNLSLAFTSSCAPDKDVIWTSQGLCNQRCRTTVNLPQPKSSRHPPLHDRGSHTWVRYVTRFFVTGSRRSQDSKWRLTKYIEVHVPIQQRRHSLRNVDDPQVILRPRFSTRGRSNQQRLFLRHPASSSTLVWTVQPTRSSACEGKQRIGQQFNVVVEV